MIQDMHGSDACFIATGPVIIQTLHVCTHIIIAIDKNHFPLSKILVVYKS